MPEDTEEPKPQKEQSSKMSRRDFLKSIVSGAAVTALPPTDRWTNQIFASDSELAGQQVEKMPIVEAMNNPLELLDRMENKILAQGAGAGEHWSRFLDTFSLEHSRDPQKAQRNREAIDYAFSGNGRGLGARIVESLDGELSHLYPDLTPEERMGMVYGGENQTLGEVLNIFKSTEVHSRAEISATDGQRPVDGMLKILEWVQPMSDLKDYKAEQAAYAHRAQELNVANRFYDNTHEAWQVEGDKASKTMLRIIEIQERYFPIANAGLGAVKPSDYPYHTGNNQETEEVFVGLRAMQNWLDYGDPGQLESTLVELIHEQSHQFQRDTLDFNLLPLIHPEDLAGDYELRNSLLASFRDKVAKMGVDDIIAFVHDPGIRIKFSKIQFIRMQTDVNTIINEMYQTQNVLGYIKHYGEDMVKEVGMEGLFAQEGGRFVFKRQDDYISRLREADVSSSISNERQVLDIHSLLMLSTYAFLTKLNSQGKLSEHPRLQEAYSEIRNTVEGQVLHATQGPPGQYLRTETSNPNIYDPPEQAMRALKERADKLRGNHPFYTEASVALVDFLYFQTVARMEAQAKLWGGNGNEDYAAFAREVIDELT